MHIGHCIKEVFDSMPRRCTVVWFANQLCCERRNIYSIFNRENIDTALLIRISLILKHNFFNDIARDLSESLDD